MKWLWLSLMTATVSLQAHASTGKVLVISGMSSEGNIAAGKGVISVLSGGNPKTLQAALAKINPAEIRAVVSFGVGGGLSASLSPGDIVVGSGVIEVETGAVLPTDPTLSKEIRSLLKAGYVHSHYGLEAVVDNNDLGSSASQKAAIGAETGALAIDNESMVAAQWAAANKLPFATIRAVDDPQSLSLPPAALDAINSDGSTDILEVLESIAQDPSQLPALIEVAWDEMTALSSLRTCSYAVDLGSL